MRALRFTATAAKGTEGLLREELKAIGLSRVKAERGGVHFYGALEAGMRACLHSRIAQRVVVELVQAPTRDAEALYDLVAEQPWEEHLTTRSTFAVEVTGRHPAFPDGRFPALKTKDAIADRLTQKLGARPDVDRDRPDVLVVVHLGRDATTLSLDLAGDPLHKRGWRTEADEAPLKETLGAALIALSGWDAARPFLDPFCGSATIAIEAAQIARKIAPGRGRHFGFHRWPTFGDDEAQIFRTLQEEAKAMALPKAPAPIVARDRFGKPLAIAERNVQRAGVAGTVTLEQRDARELQGLPAEVVLVTNPPYGERIGGKPMQLQGLFRQFGEAFAKLPKTADLCVLAGTPALPEAFQEAGLRPSAPLHTLFNGPLEVRAVRYRGKG